MFIETITKRQTHTCIDVTPNVEYCFRVLEQAISELPEGDTKTASEKALDYLLKTAEGKEQIYDGAHCNYRIVIPPWI